LAEWIETEVIEYTRLLVNNPNFTKDLQEQLGQETDVSEIDTELANYQAQLKKLERNKSSLEHDIDSLSVDDRRAERKRQDMSRRLNELYEQIYDMEDPITACEQKKAAVEQEIFTAERALDMLSVFDGLFDTMNEAEKREALESLIAEVHLRPKETWEEGKSPIEKIVYTFPIYESAMTNLGENLAPVSMETLL